MMGTAFQCDSCKAFFKDENQIFVLTGHSMDGAGDRQTDGNYYDICTKCCSKSMQKLIDVAVKVDVKADDIKKAIGVKR
jgi:hypothetical protein